MDNPTEPTAPVTDDEAPSVIPPYQPLAKEGRFDLLATANGLHVGRLAKVLFEDPTDPNRDDVVIRGINVQQGKELIEHIGRYVIVRTIVHVVDIESFKPEKTGTDAPAPDAPETPEETPAESGK